MQVVVKSAVAETFKSIARDDRFAAYNYLVKLGIISPEQVPEQFRTPSSTVPVSPTGQTQARWTKNGARSRILKLLKANPGMITAEINAHFSTNLPRSVRYALRLLEQDGWVRRVRVRSPEGNWTFRYWLTEDFNATEDCAGPCLEGVLATLSCDRWLTTHEIQAILPEVNINSVQRYVRIFASNPKYQVERRLVQGKPKSRGTKRVYEYRRIPA